ncbi:MAG TPA: DNA repair protein RecN [Pseudobacteroides sp.]|uniref:DNA repair protein RecN n=1 Tax=Pseudobacteroides sp. TaxID=1968840 RepID=UPI002F955E7B
MLQQLEIQNIALIEKICIEVGKGLNVLTGETGAGKSIIIDSINAILGERLSKELIRTGKDKASVEAVFQIENKNIEAFLEEIGVEPEEDGTLIISREFTLSGKNSCRINGKMVTVSMLKELGSRLVDVHGQHDNQSLLRTESHIELLDSFGSNQIDDLKDKYTNLLVEYKNIKSKVRALAGDKNDREKKIDFLSFQIDEIKKAKLKIGEDEELNRQRNVLSNAERIIEALSGVYENIFSGNNIKSSVYDSLSDAISQLSSISKLDEKYGKLAVKLEEISYQLDDVVEQIRKERDNTEYSPDLLEQVEERIDLIVRLKKKYGATIEDVLEYLKKAESEYDEIIKSDEIVNELNKKLVNIAVELYDTAAMLNDERNKAARILEEQIGKELEDLEMKKAQFKVNIDFNSEKDENDEYKFWGNGLNKVEFLISPNAGEPLKPLSKIVSGGEMSRIMLAIKTILANVDDIPTLIFDEIDIGISGKAAQKVAEKLSIISGSHQVLCVTHLAQIACMADGHFQIEKQSIDNLTKTSVRRISDKEIKNEIARILGGSNISDITLKHAEEILGNAKKFKINSRS